MTCHAERKDSGSPHRSRAVIKIALLQPAAIKNQLFFQTPTFARELVKWSKGNMANGSCKANTT